MGPKVVSSFNLPQILDDFKERERMIKSGERRHERGSSEKWNDESEFRTPY
jgi:hypothetical protein